MLTDIVCKAGLHKLVMDDSRLKGVNKFIMAISLIVGLMTVSKLLDIFV